MNLGAYNPHPKRLTEARDTASQTAHSLWLTEAICGSTKLAMTRIRIVIVLSLAGLAACVVRSGEPNGAQSPSRAGDACAALNTKIAALPDGATLPLDAGPYLCDRGLVIERKKRITLQGPSPSRPAVFRFARGGPLKTVGPRSDMSCAA